MDSMKLSLFGTLGRDVEVKFTPTGKIVGEVSVAVDTGWGDKKQTVWIKAVIWGKDDKILFADFAGKGTRVYLEGLPSVEAWTGKDGSPKARLVLTVRDWKIVSGWKQKDEETGVEAGVEEENPFY